MPGYRDELEAISTLRNRYSRLPQRTFARKVKDRDFTDPNDHSLAARLINRTYASVYGAVRRIDQKIGNATSKALAGV
jgi:hypothetical protein